MNRLNLATRPYGNERLPNRLALAVAAFLLLLSGYHAFVARDLLPDRTSALNRTLADLEAESARVRAEATELRGVKPDGGDLARWTQLKELVDRRAFSWSALFTVLQETLPDGVRLSAVAPSSSKGQTRVTLRATARSHEEALQFMKALEDRAEFAEVYPTGRTGEDYQYDMRYLPSSPSPGAPRTAAADPAPTATPAASDAPPTTAPPPAAAVMTPPPTPPPSQTVRSLP